MNHSHATSGIELWRLLKGVMFDVRAAAYACMITSLQSHPKPYVTVGELAPLLVD